MPPPTSTSTSMLRSACCTGVTSVRCCSLDAHLLTRTVRSSSFCHQHRSLSTSASYLISKLRLSPTHDIANNSLAHTGIFEVERRFVPESCAFRIFRKEDKWPGPELVRRLSPPNGYAMTDIYHDTSNVRLLKARIYVRQRNNEWQMKARRTGGLVSTGCIEMCGKAQVELALRSEGFDTALSGLKPLAKMDTVRRKWKAGDFTLSVDDSLVLLERHGAAEGKVVKIPHSVGDVELWEEVDEKNTVSKMKEMAKEIDDFVGRYDEVFQGRHNGLCQRVSEGKLTAFLRWQQILRAQRFLPDSR